MALRQVEVLIAVSGGQRRGAQVEAVELAERLTAASRPSKIIAVSAGNNEMGLMTSGSAWWSPSTLRRLRAAGRSGSILLAYGSTSLPALAAATIGTRSQTVYRSIGNPSDWVRGQVHQLRTRTLMSRMHHVVALWAGARDSISNLYGLPPTSITVIPNARDPALFACPDENVRHDARRIFGIDEERVVAMIGALSPEKNHFLAIEMMRGLDDVHLLIAGDGPLRPEIESRAKSAGVRATFLGPLADVRPVLLATDRVILTSKTEGMPGVLIEAAMCGVPFIATDVGAVASMAGPHDIVVPSGAHPSEVQACLQRSLSMSIDPLHVSRRAVELYSWDRVLPMWVDFLNTLHRVHEPA